LGRKECDVKILYVLAINLAN